MDAEPRARWTATLVDWLTWSQDAILDALAHSDPEVIRTRPGGTAPSVGFHAWHIGRWADRHQAALPGWLDFGPDAPEIWVADRLAAQWGFAGIGLGRYGGIGAGLDDVASAALPLPGPDVITRYVERSFGALITGLRRIDDDALLERTVVDLRGESGPFSEVLLGLLSHTDRHLGMIEATRGMLGERGTATE